MLFSGRSAAPAGTIRFSPWGSCDLLHAETQDEADFGGYREDVLTRDNHRCAVPGCTTLKRGKRSTAVHHRKPGYNDPELMISLCLACHAKVTRTQFLNREWPPLLRVLWREQHPKGHEQTALNFGAQKLPARTVPLFKEDSDK